MTFGKDFFRILNLIVVVMRLFAKIFGDESDKEAVRESEARTENSDSNEAC